MLHLLMHTSLFVNLGANNFLQLAGRNLVEVGQGWGVGGAGLGLDWEKYGPQQA